MTLSDAIFAIFGFLNTLRIVSYIPQIIFMARDRNGATAISNSSWAI